MAINKYLDKAGLEHLGEVLVPEIKSRLKKVGELPTASSTYEGQTYLLTAPQTGYIEGGIYKCEEVTPSTSPKTYYWKLISGNGVEYPQYVKDEKDRVLTELQALHGIENPIVIGFSTDQHLTDASEKYTLENLRSLKTLTHEFPFNVCVLGGDCQYNIHRDIARTNEKVNAIANTLDGANCPVFHLIGNHDCRTDMKESDYSSSDVFGSHRTLPIKENYAVTRDESTNCYYDDISCNVRFIFICSEFMSNYREEWSRRFLANALATLPTGYEAIIFSHRPLGNLPDDPSTRVDDWNDPLKWGDTVNPYADRIIACIDGHTHADKSTILDGILYLSTTTAGWAPNDGTTREDKAGTAQCTAYDVFVIDRTAKIIHAVRYGNGNNRDIQYKSISYTNMIPTSIDEEGNVYNDIGYKRGARLTSTGKEEADPSDEIGVTGFIPLQPGCTVRFKNCSLQGTYINGIGDYFPGYARVSIYGSSFACYSTNRIADIAASGTWSPVLDHLGNLKEVTVPSHGSWKYMRVCSTGINEHSLITVNEVIPPDLPDPIPDDGTDIDFTNWEV